MEGQGQHDRARGLLLESAVEMMIAKQYHSGADLADLAVQSLVKCGVDETPEIIGLCAQFLQYLKYIYIYSIVCV
jgi:hypothetical protein